MKVAVCIPWFDSGCEWRKRAADWTMRYWAEHAQTFVVSGHTQDTPSRSAARNASARGVDADVLVFADADTFIPMNQFHVMVDSAAKTDRLVHGYREHLHMTKAATLRLYESDQRSDTGTRIANQPLGIVAVSRKVWETVGGFDERFVGWGGEDRAFELACHCLMGPGTRVPGLSYHLWHPQDPAKGRGTQQRRANQRLALEYKRLSGWSRAAGSLPHMRSARADPDGMLALLAEHAGPLHDRSVRATT